MFCAAVALAFTLQLVGVGCGAKHPPHAPPQANVPSVVVETRAGKPDLNASPAGSVGNGHACANEPPPDTIEASMVLIQWAESEKAQPAITRTKDEAKARARECRNAIRAGTPFAAVVEDCSDAPDAAKRDGRIGAFHRHEMIKEFSDVAFALCVGEISEAVETRQGYAIIWRTK